MGILLAAYRVLPPFHGMGAMLLCSEPRGSERSSVLARPVSLCTNHHTAICSGEGVVGMGSQQISMGEYPATYHILRPFLGMAAVLYCRGPRCSEGSSLLTRSVSLCANYHMLVCSGEGGVGKGSLRIPMGGLSATYQLLQSFRGLGTVSLCRGTRCREHSGL